MLRNGENDSRSSSSQPDEGEEASNGTIHRPELALGICGAMTHGIVFYTNPRNCSPINLNAR